MTTNYEVTLFHFQTQGACKWNSRKSTFFALADPSLSQTRNVRKADKRPTDNNASSCFATHEIEAKSVGIVARPRKLDRIKRSFWVTSTAQSARFLSLQAVNFLSRRHVWERRPAGRPRNRRIWFACADWSLSQISSLFAKNIEKKGRLLNLLSKIESYARLRCGNAGFCAAAFEGVRAVQSGLALVTTANRSRESARRCTRIFRENSTLSPLLCADDQFASTQQLATTAAPEWAWATVSAPLPYRISISACNRCNENANQAFPGCLFAVQLTRLCENGETCLYLCKNRQQHPKKKIMFNQVFWNIE